MKQCIISEEIARFCVSLKYEDIPLSIIEKTKRHILDTLDAGIVVNDNMASDEEPFVTVITDNGESHKMRVEIPLGSPTNPMSDKELLNKYRSIATMIWPGKIVDRLSQLILSLEIVSDMNEIVNIVKTTPFKRDIIR